MQCPDRKLYSLTSQVDLRHESDLDLRKPFSAMSRHEPEVAASTFDRNAPKTPPVEVGIDLTEFYMSVEWDILEVTFLVTLVVIVPFPGACHQKCEVLHLLRRTLSGHHLQHHHEEEDLVLHGQMISSFQL